ncbi:MAG: arginine--tRNA ligase [Alphaproteobacteria bacterium]|nr:arginine--tRNA ligase [Alphaproteobacteria bacterium]
MTLASALTALVNQAVDTAGFAGQAVPPVVPTNNPEHGDYQSNVALRLGRSLDEKIEAAGRIVASLPANDLIESCEVVKPGFINFRLSPVGMARTLEAAANSATNGVPQHGGTLVIDFSSPNIAKRFHVGHLRSTVIGDAIHRIYEACGWRVVADNHLGDWGTQFGKLIVAWNEWRDELAYEEDPIHEVQRLYQHFNQVADDEDAVIKAQCDEDALKEDVVAEMTRVAKELRLFPTWSDRAREETAKLQRGDPANIALWEKFVDASMREFDAIYARMGVEFDETLGESAYRNELQDLVDEWVAAGVAEESQGAIVIPFTKADGKGLSAPLLVRKRDGSALYGTTDLATIKHRMLSWAPDRIVYVVDSRQQGHFRQVFAAAKKLGYDRLSNGGEREPVHFEHAWFGTLRFADGAIASTRAGATANLVDVLDQAVGRARAVVEQKSDHLPEDEKAAIAEIVGVGTVKYFDLRQNPQSDITFDWDESLALNGNTAVYLMYAHARCRSILRNAERDVPVSGIVVSHALERELVLALNRLREVVWESAETYRPNLVADQLYTIASVLARFWNDCRVLGSDEEGSRLALVRATADSMRFGLGLLGIDAPERM